VVGVLQGWVGVHQAAGPLSFYTLWVPLVPPRGRGTAVLPKSSQNESVIVRGGLGGLTTPPARLGAALHKHLTALPK